MVHISHFLQIAFHVFCKFYQILSASIQVSSWVFASIPITWLFSRNGTLAMDFDIQRPILEELRFRSFRINPPSCTCSTPETSQVEGCRLLRRSGCLPGRVTWGSIFIPFWSIFWIEKVVNLTWTLVIRNPPEPQRSQWFMVFLY